MMMPLSASPSLVPLAQLGVEPGAVVALAQGEGRGSGGATQVRESMADVKRCGMCSQSIKLP
jgi:hypothetical protein